MQWFRFSCLLLWLVVLPSTAETRWQFEPAIAVTEKSEDRFFIHLEGANRQHLALTESLVAVSWEDDRSGDPQVYLSINHGDGFSKPLQISRGDEAYEPSITAMPQDRVVIAYEQDGKVHARVWGKHTGVGEAGSAIQLSAHESGQVTLVSMGDLLFASWRERVNGSWQLMVARLQLSDLNINLLSTKAVEAQPLPAPVLFPAMALTPAGLCIAWEDRRSGHTRLQYSVSRDLGQSFSRPAYLNEFLSNRNEYDKGNGVTRVSLVGLGQDEVLAAWMDKRRGHAGYGIFAAMATEAGNDFGPNEKVHGQKGDEMPHYNPVAVGNRDGQYAVIWDDFRQGDADIWLSVHNDDFEWGEDFSPPVASGPGEQTHASARLDAEGNLHLIWLHREHLDAPAQLWYSLGRLTSPQD